MPFTSGFVTAGGQAPVSGGKRERAAGIGWPGGTAATRRALGEGGRTRKKSTRVIDGGLFCCPIVEPPFFIYN